MPCTPVRQESTDVPSSRQNGDEWSIWIFRKHFKCFILIAVQHTDKTQHDGFESQLWEKKYHVAYHPIHMGNCGEGNCLQEPMIDLGSFLVHYEPQLRLRAGWESYK